MVVQKIQYVHNRMIHTTEQNMYSKYGIERFQVMMVQSYIVLWKRDT